MFQQGEREDIRNKRNTQYVKWVMVLRRKKRRKGRDAGDASKRVGVEWATAKVLSRHRPKVRVRYGAIWQKAFQTQGIGPKRGNP